MNVPPTSIPTRAVGIVKVPERGSSCQRSVAGGLDCSLAAGDWKLLFIRDDAHVRHPFYLPQCVADFAGNDEADEAVGARKRLAVARMGEEDWPRSGRGQLDPPRARAKAIGADHFHLCPVTGPEQIDQIEQAHATEGKRPGRCRGRWR